MEEELAMEGKEAWRMEEGKEWTVEEGKDGVWNLRGKILKKPSKQKWMLTTETVFCEVPGIFLGAEVQMEEWGGGWRCFLYALTAYISQMCLHTIGSRHLVHGVQAKSSVHFHLSPTCEAGRQEDNPG